jgi:hypothetical protein
LNAQLIWWFGYQAKLDRLKEGYDQIGEEEIFEIINHISHQYNPIRPILNKSCIGTAKLLGLFQLLQQIV